MKFLAKIMRCGPPPPTFLLQAWDDPVDKICNSTLYAGVLDMAGVPAEVHLFGNGGHAFGLRKTNQGIASWPTLVESWLTAKRLVDPPTSNRGDGQRFIQVEPIRGVA